MKRSIVVKVEESSTLALPGLRSCLEEPQPSFTVPFNVGVCKARLVAGKVVSSTIRDNEVLNVISNSIEHFPVDCELSSTI